MGGCGRDFKHPSGNPGSAEVSRAELACRWDMPGEPLIALCYHMGCHKERL